MDESPTNDHSNAEWSPEIKQAYEHLKIPSLYDAVLANEKLSVEIRKQDRNLKMMNEALQALVAQITTLVDIVQEEWEEYEDDEDEDELENESEEERRKRLQLKRQDFGNVVEGDLTDLEVELLGDKQFYLEDQSQEVIMEAHDILLDLSRKTKQMTRQLLHTLPKQDKNNAQELSWISAVEEISQNLVEESERSRYRLLTHLEDLAIQPIEPKPGDSFDPALHHILEYIPGGSSGTIGQIIRIGYRQQTQILRLAEVTVYH